MKIFRLVSFATEKTLFQSFSELQALFFFFFALFFIFKFMLQLPDLSPFSFPFNFCFRLCLLYAAIHDLGNKALFSGKVLTAILQVLTYFVEPYIFYLKHLVNRQNSGTHLNCRLSYGTNFFQGQNMKNKYCVLNTNFQSQVLLFLPSKFQKLICIFCRYNILILLLVLYFLE